ncbi:MAG: phosphatidate cytidylyltransferase [Dehalococcoidia bacterium]
MVALRVVTTIVGVPVVLALIRLGGIGFSVAVAVFLVIAVLEFFAAATSRGNPQPVIAPALARLPPPIASLLPSTAPALLGAAFVALVVAGAHAGDAWWPGALAVGALVGWGWLLLRGQTEDALYRWLWMMGGIVYVGWLGSHLVLLRKLDGDGDWLLMAVGATFMADTGAYLVGRALGRRPLAPAISPGKTVEGALGGVAAGWGGLLLLNYATGLRLEPGLAVPLGLLLAVAAPLGDLAESLLKRSAGVKDTGAILPGHGGVLDRLDSILFVSVVVYYYAIWATG